VKISELKFSDPLAAAREAVRALRNREHVDLVVMIGHEHAEDDYAVAKSVAGIDVIFGSHSHLKRDLTRIPGTDTWFISSGQYLSYISRVELTIENGRVTAAQGRLLAVDDKLPVDRAVANRVLRMQRQLENDPQYAELFQSIGRLDAPLPVAEVAQRTLAAMRAGAKADIALSTTSSVRSPLPAGTLTMELLRAAMPYDNEIVVCAMTGPQLQRVLDFNAQRAGTDAESMISRAPHVDTTRADATYRVATTDYLAFVAYAEVFQCDRVRTGLRVRDEVRKMLTTNPSP
jgi:5'-nucleotidase